MGICCDTYFAELVTGQKAVDLRWALRALDGPIWSNISGSRIWCATAPERHCDIHPQSSCHAALRAQLTQHPSCQDKLCLPIARYQKVADIYFVQSGVLAFQRSQRQSTKHSLVPYKAKQRWSSYYEDLKDSAHGSTSFWQGIFQRQYATMATPFPGPTQYA